MCTVNQYLAHVLRVLYSKALKDISLKKPLQVTAPWPQAQEKKKEVCLSISHEGGISSIDNPKDLTDDKKAPDLIAL